MLKQLFFVIVTALLLTAPRIDALAAEVIPSYDATLQLDIIAKLSNNSAKFKLTYELGDEIVDGQTVKATAVKFVIPDLNFETDLDNSGSFTFTLTNLKNKTYTYYILSTNGEQYSDMFDIDFVTSIKQDSILMDVLLNYQIKRYPEGCESFATVAVLKYLRYNINEDVFIREYLDRIRLNDSRLRSMKNIFDKYYLGDPTNKTEQGYLANPPVLINAVNKYFRKYGFTKHKPVNTTGTPLLTLLNEQVFHKTPVIIWLTINNKPPKIAKVKNIPYIYPSHTIVISGYDKKTKMLHVTDSISGKRYISYDVANKIYEQTGRKSFILK